MTEPIFLKTDQVLKLHARSIAAHGGTMGLRDRGGLEAAINQPRNAHDYGGEDLAGIAAAYAFHIVEGQCFLDGNKRTAISSALAFLRPFVSTAPHMEPIIYPRSPRETMCGWIYLPRFIDKIRLHLAGRLHPDYQENFTEGFDGRWLQAAGLEAAPFIEVVRGTITDGQVADWVRQNVRKTDAEKQALADFILKRGADSDEMKARLEMRKQQAGLSHRSDIRTFVDFIDADEKRL